VCLTFILCGRSDFGDLAVGHIGQAHEHLTKIGKRIKTAPAAVLNDRINDGATLAGMGIANEKPVFLADGGGPDGIFHQVVVDLDSAIFQKDLQRRPLAQRIIHGLAPLFADRLDGRQIAAHLESLFRKHGAPLFLKRDNGSPFNHQQVDEVLARFRVLPLNNPPRFPRYNGAMEKSIRDFKAALAKRLSNEAKVPLVMSLAAEVTAHELNHRPRRCLKGRTACAVFHDDAQRLRWTKRQRQTIFRLLLQQFGAMIGKTAKGHQPSPATLWRVTVESWLRCQGLIVIRQNQNVSTSFQKIWSHN
jgi:transposase InsO family protein